MGYDALKPEQERAVCELVRGKDVFVALPTGYGKSLCYGCLPRVFDYLKAKEEPNSIVLVVSPLVSIMKDQVASFTSMGIKAAYVSSDPENRQTKQAILEGNYQLVFISPEQLLARRSWRTMLRSDEYQTRLEAFVVDEAHCVKKWGEEFRKEFANLGEVRSLLPGSVCMMALTATATRSLRCAVVKTLGMSDPTVVSVSPDKRNIVLAVSKGDSLETTFVPVMKHLKEKRTAMERVIIYCQRQEDCARLYLLFKMNVGAYTEPIGAPDLPEYRLVDMYTSCTSPDVKEDILRCFTSSSPLRVLIATIAFGMGVNPPDVRYTLHCGPPVDIETYIQEIGRGGRDGEESYAILFVAKGFTSRYASEEIKEYCRPQDVCRRDLLFHDFDEYEHPANVGCRCCDNCYKSCSCGDCLLHLPSLFQDLVTHNNY